MPSSAAWTRTRRRCASIPRQVAGARVRLRLDWRTFAGLVLAVLDRAGADRADPQHLDDAHAGRAGRADRLGARPHRRFDRAALAPPAGLRRRHRRRRRRRARRLARRRARATGRRPGPQLLRSSSPRRSISSSHCRCVGPYIRQNQVGERVQEWVRQLPEQFTDERIAELAGALVSGIASVAIVAILTIAVLVDGPEPPRAPAPAAPPAATRPGRRRRRRDVPHDRALLRRVDHRRRADGPVRAGARLVAGDPPRPVGRAVGDAHRPHPPGRRVPRRVVPRPAGVDAGRDDGARSPAPPSCCT